MQAEITWLSVQAVNWEVTQLFRLKRAFLHIVWDYKQNLLLYRLNLFCNLLKYGGTGGKN